MICLAQRADTAEARLIMLRFAFTAVDRPDMQLMCLAALSSSQHWSLHSCSGLY